MRINIGAWNLCKGIIGMAGLVAVLGCSSGGGKGADDLADGVGQTDAATELTADLGLDVVPGDGSGTEVREDLLTDLGREVGDSELTEDADVSDVIPPPYPMGFVRRGFLEMRGIVHLHSAFSHDGCGPDGYEDFGGPDPACIRQLREAACETGMSFVMMTDHPGHTRDHPYEEGILHWENEGDQLLEDELGRPYVNQLNCPAGGLVPRTWFYYGTEGHKNMPIAMAGPIPPEVYSVSYHDEIPLEQVQEAVAMARELGGYAFGVHTEEKKISEQRIVDIPLDGMEIYNLHSNLITALKSLDELFAVDSFMDPSPGAPHPDLALLLFLAPVLEDERKFDYAAARIPIAAIAATDIHQNVEIPVFCPQGVTPGSLCEPFAADYPYFVQNLVTGGPAILSDGDRMDSYSRSFRWFTNRAIVAKDDPQAAREAIGKGRSYSIFELFGWSDSFDFHLVHGETHVEMGTEMPYEEGMTIRMMSPRLIDAPWWPQQTLDLGLAVVRTRLIRSTLEGAETILEWTGQEVWQEVPVPGPGAYRVQVEIIPHHLVPMLSGVEHLAEKEFPYIYSNAIFIR